MTASSPATDTDALTAAVWAALGEVRDPELDEPLTTLGFVSRCHVGPDGGAVVRLRLPTYFCAPNFAFMMMSGAREAVSSVSGVTGVDVALEDHFAAEAINAGVGAGAGFAETFGGLAAGELDELRAEFLRKAVLAATDRACRPLLLHGLTSTDLAAMTLGQLPVSADADRLRSRRSDLRLPCGDDAPLVVDPSTGHAVSDAAMERHLARARLTRLSVEANAEVCGGLLRHRVASVHLTSRSACDAE